MPRDYKHRSQPKSVRRPTPGWVWLLTGVLLGGFAVGLAWLRLDPPEDLGGGWIGAPPPPAPVESQPAPVEEPEPQAPASPRFDFFTLLPRMEVVVPEEELEPAPADAPSSPAAATAPPAAGYLLQVGSFRNDRDADRLKAQLLLAGFEASVVRVRSERGQVWHRVRTGPYRDTRSLKAARTRLAANGIRNPLVIRLQQP